MYGGWVWLGGCVGVGVAMDIAVGLGVLVYPEEMNINTYAIPTPTPTSTPTPPHPQVYTSIIQFKIGFEIRSSLCTLLKNYLKIGSLDFPHLSEDLFNSLSVFLIQNIPPPMSASKLN
jgi:hypothetical protein